MKYFEAELVKPAIVAVDDAVSDAEAGEKLNDLCNPHGISIGLTPSNAVPQDPAIADFVVGADGGVVVNSPLDKLFGG